MPIQDKHRLLPDLKDVRLELGCGERKRNPGDIGIDAIDYPCVDLVGDVLEVLKAIGNDVIDGVSSFHFFEHLPNVAEVLDELARVMKAGASLEIVVPHFSNPYYYSDLTHRTPFGLYSFAYLANGSSFSRKVPRYSLNKSLEIRSVDLIFKSPRPFYGRYVIKRALGALFNVNRYTQEFYEENLCYLVPCYEISFRLLKVR